MAATNATTITTVKKPTAIATVAKAATPTTRASTTSAAASSIPAQTASAATNMQSATPQSATQTPKTGLFSGLSLASFLGLPATIDYQDIAIRVGLVLTGVVLLVLVGWAFVRGKQETVVNVQQQPGAPASDEAKK